MHSASDRAVAARRLVQLPLALTVALMVGACTPTPTPSTSTSTPTATSTTSTSAPSATLPEPTPVATPPGATAGTTACLSTGLAARVTAWDAATGHRIAHVEMKNTGSAACSVPGLTRPQLVDGAGTVLIEGAPVAVAPPVTIDAGATVSADVQDGNYCGPDPVAPVTVAFELPASAGTVVAAPLGPTDLTGLPPCSGSTVPGSIEMQPWSK